MSKCKHERIQIIETGTVLTTHRRNADCSWHHDTEPGDYHVMIEVYCPDCYLNRSYGTKKPKWLIQLLDEMPAAPDASYIMVDNGERDE